MYELTSARVQERCPGTTVLDCEYQATEPPEGLWDIVADMGPFPLKEAGPKLGIQADGEGSVLVDHATQDGHLEVNGDRTFRLSVRITVLGPTAISLQFGRDLSRVELQ